MSKSGFFLSRPHVGWDSRFSSKIRRISTRSGWLHSRLTVVVSVSVRACLHGSGGPQEGEVTRFGG